MSEKRCLKSTIVQISIEKLNLSVRANNCLKIARIKTIGDLIRVTEERLMGYKNMGMKSVNEIKEKLVEYDLEFGMKDFTIIEEDISTNTKEDISMNTKKEIRKSVLNTPIEQLYLSDRSSNCLKIARIKTLGDLIKVTEERLIGYKNMGKKSVNEIKRLLSKYGLDLGENSITIIDEHCEGKRLNFSECIAYIKGMYLEGNRIYDYLGSEKSGYILYNRIGINGIENTLEVIGKKFNMTRERVRQIEAKSCNKLYKMASQELKNYIKEWLNLFKRNTGVCCCENYSEYKGCNEIILFNMFLRLFDKKIKFDHDTGVWKNENGNKFIEIMMLKVQDRLEVREYTEDEIRDIVFDFMRREGLRNSIDICSLVKVVINELFVRKNENYEQRNMNIVEEIEVLINKYYENGLYLNKQWNKFIEYAKKEGYEKIAISSKRLILANISRSKNLVLWGWGTYRHIKDIDINKEMLKIISTWLSDKFSSGLKRISIWGAFKEYKQLCECSGINNEHALYSCMKMVYGEKFSFLKDPYVYQNSIKKAEKKLDVIDEHIRTLGKAIKIKDVKSEMGMKSFQIAQYMVDTTNVIRWGEKELIHINCISVNKDEMNNIVKNMSIRISDLKHLSVKSVFQNNVLYCKKNGIFNSRTLYSYLRKFHSMEYLYPGYPIIIINNHGIKDDGRFSLNDIIDNYFELNNRIVYDKELKEYLVNKRGYRDNILDYITTICTNIVKHTNGSHVSLSSLNWGGEKSIVLERIAMDNYKKRCKYGQPYAYIRNLLELELPKINEKIEIYWQYKLLTELLKRLDKIKIIGTNEEVYISAPNEYNVNDVEDLLCHILKSEFHGAVNLSVFSDRLKELKIMSKFATSSTVFSNIKIKDDVIYIKE